jgi:hypothetical protein
MPGWWVWERIDWAFAAGVMVVVLLCWVWIAFSEWHDDQMEIEDRAMRFECEACNRGKGVCRVHPGPK